MKSYKEKLYSVTPGNFNERALELFRYQVRHNPVYAEYVNEMGINWRMIRHSRDIPFLPISFFKHHVIKTGKWKETSIFESSGTTSANRSRHYVEDESFYLRNCLRIFNMFYGQVDHYIIFALLPGYLNNPHSSLISMVRSFIEKSGHPLSGSYLDQYDDLKAALKEALVQSERQIMLWGVTHALLDLAEEFPMDLGRVIVMETGGMKGRREEMVREEVHRILTREFNRPRIHSEYGMTELMSQAYAERDGLFRTPPWMQVFTREINDPLSVNNELRQGVINVIDLANIHSCAFIGTEDLGRIREDGSFEVLGRLDHADIRGCNLLIH